ncbi:MAG: isopentenyl-diphosphate delta-isomerase [Flavobacteriales bacterium]|nr:isopentenyl-diphosphate delta-isomerase [Flavobacteriales bacterium]|tara:strand:- start:1597 stop:2136 length:540 start_codon:yes stop_codon:yes gene_type:complete
MEEQVILVDKKDNVIGKAGKLEAHQKGLLHRALSVFIFNSKGEILLQQRAPHKYHTPFLWSNTACSHPRINELVKHAAERRLKEEMGIECNLYYAFNFLYNAKFDNHLIENELDHVFIGFCDEIPKPNPSEVKNYRYINSYDLMNEINENPNIFTPWFKICIDRVLKVKSIFEKEVLIA